MTVTSITIQSGASIAGVPSLVSPDVTRADLYPLRSNNSRRPVEYAGPQNNLRFPSDIGKYYFKIGIHKFNRSGFGISNNTYVGGGSGKYLPILSSQHSTVGTLIPNGNIVLPMPSQLVDHNAVDFQGTPTFDVNALIAGATGFLGKGVGSATGSNGLASLAGGALSSSINAALGATGIAPNQFLTILLKGPLYKRHTFSWKLYPKNKEESIVLNKIVNIIKDSMRPGLAGAGTFFAFPSIFVLNFSNESALYAFKPAALENLSINFTPSGSPAFHSDMYPDGIELVMNFIELEYWLNENNNYDNLGKDFTSNVLGALDNLVTGTANFIAGAFTPPGFGPQ